MTLSLRQLRYFVGAAETGQVSRAAVELNVSQSAVTGAIKQLELRLGTRLFDRHPNGVTLTFEGSRFLQHARNIIASVDEALRVPSVSTTKAQGPIRIGVTYTVAGYFMPQHQARFSRSYPAATIELREAPREAIEEELMDGRLDIAVLLTSNLENRMALDHETLIRSRRRLWLPIDHPMAGMPEIRLEHVAQEPYVMLTVDEAQQTAERYWEKTPFRPRTIFRTSSVEAVRSMVANGTGITILSDMVYRPWSLEGQRIETRNVYDLVPSMDLGLAWKRDAELSPAARAFHDFMCLTFNGGGPGLTH
ncbi:LysR family transcriptional regulator [Microbaculum marinisediminis]|uniref:LysR family transcriptional regulator n=1 Tax=Microbaculum marinisediminis TaxID=2931392 RepID=A0AAW5QY14_9HYPH|nr:LysR family transcriptional regulator [Microbaculum sp. A6E488]MCT8971326.1 LysR family transcriptional regulator [Microbaculum sp. A6E488]